jgi:hypothetical protein
VHPVVSGVRPVRLFQLVLGLKPLIQGIAAIHRPMLVVNLASTVLNILQSGRVMMRMAVGLFIGQRDCIVKTTYVMNFPKPIHKSLFLRHFLLYSLILPAVYLTHS